MCIDVSNSAPTPAARRSGPVPSTAAHSSHPAARNIACSTIIAARWVSASIRSAGRCQPHTVASSTNDIANGVTTLGQRRAGSNRLSASPKASSGAAMATAIMWPAICPTMPACAAASHPAGSSSSPAIRLARLIGNPSGTAPVPP